MDLEKFGTLCKCMFIIIETILNIEHEDYVSKVLDVFQRTCSCLLDSLKRNTRFPILLFLCTEQFTYTNLLTFFLQDRTAQNMQNEHSLYYLLLHLFPSLCPHTVF